jgi:hypothetical protein
VAAIEPATRVAQLQEAPDAVVILVREREVGVVPVHPVAEPLALLADHAGVVIDALFTLIHELGDTIVLDLALVGEAQLLLDRDLDPQALAIETLLPAQLLAEHSVVAIVEVFIGATPGVVDAHRVVGGDRPVEKRPLRAAVSPRAQLLERPRLGPEAQDFVLELDIVRPGGYIAKHCYSPLHSSKSVVAYASNISNIIAVHGRSPPFRIENVELRM